MSFSDFFSPERSPMPFDKLRLYAVSTWSRTGAYEGETGESRSETRNLNAADVASSQFRDSQDHMVILDLDVPAALIPSSTPGHSHLYIESAMSWETYERLLDALAEAGVLEEGYVAASKRRKATHVRLPWVRKNG